MQDVYTELIWNGSYRVCNMFRFRAPNSNYKQLLAYVSLTLYRKELFSETFLKRASSTITDSNL